MVLRQNALQVYHGLCLAALLISPPPGPLDTMLRSLIYELWFVRCPVASRCQINIVFGLGEGGESQTAPFSLFSPIHGPYLGVVSDAKRWLGVVSEAKANRIFMSDLAFENCLGLILSICIAVAAHVPRRA